MHANFSYALTKMLLIGQNIGNTLSSVLSKISKWPVQRSTHNDSFFRIFNKHPFLDYSVDRLFYDLWISDILSMIANNYVAIFERQVYNLHHLLVQVYQ